MPHYDWIWTRPNWQAFEHDPKALAKHTAQFAFNAESGTCPSIYFSQEHADNVAILIQGIEAIETSAIEGEKLHHSSVIGSMRYRFEEMALHKPATINARERRSGIVSAMIDAYVHFDKPLSRDTLDHWNELLTQTNTEIKTKGRYRTHAEDMIITGSRRIDDETPSYVAPPSKDVPKLMDNFIQWYNDTGPKGDNPMPPLQRASLAHLYFVMIHPYEDGNGRMSRIIAEKALSESYGKPTLISLSHRIAQTKKEYYEHLENAARHGDIDGWMNYFCKTIVEAQELTAAKLKKAKIKIDVEDKHYSRLNPRQKKVLEQMFNLGGNSFPDGITYTKYQRMTTNMMGDNKNQKQQALIDLDDMVAKGILEKNGDRKGAKYTIKGLDKPMIESKSNVPVLAS